MKKNHLPDVRDAHTIKRMEFDSRSLFDEMAPEQQVAITELARHRALVVGEVLFYEGDSADDIILLVSGQISMSQGTLADSVAMPGQLLDIAASLGGLTHSASATAIQACELLIWAASDLWPLPGFQAAARGMLGRSLKQVATSFAEISAPVHYTGRAHVAAGPFAFDDTTLLIAFCDADREAIAALLPEGLSLLAAPNGSRAPIFIGMAYFPDAHPEHDPRARFAYTETTFFIPVRCGVTPGVFIPYIYPSTWEPILIGREVYGFPKQLGLTEIGGNRADLSVAGGTWVQLGWTGLQASDETHLVGALMAWLGTERHIAAAAFQIGDVLRMAASLPAYRRVDVFNRKQILSMDAMPETPVFAVDHLTHAVFGVKRWSGISRMAEPTLTISGGPLAGAEVRLQEAYRTLLDMRLSTSEIVGA